MSKLNLNTFSLIELWVALNYYQGLADHAQKLTQLILETCKSNNADPQQNFKRELEKSFLAFEEASQVGEGIERELDRRMKKSLKTRYGAKSLTDIALSMEEKFREHFSHGLADFQSGPSVEY